MPKMPKPKPPNYVPNKVHTGNERSNAVHKSYKWRELSKKLRSTAICEPCNFIWVQVHASQDVDHIYPLPLGAPFDEANLMPMCKAMHGKKSQLDKEGFRVASYRASGGLAPINRDDILIALRDFDDRTNDEPLDTNWI